MEKLEQAYISKFENLDYESFKKMAQDPNLLPNEKVGFPNTYRAGKELLIWQDIQSKLTNLQLPEQTILDIGPGCSQLPQFLLSNAEKNKAKVILCDCQEMLCQLPEGKYIEKIEGPFPNCWENLSQYMGLIDVILVYSVFHYIFGTTERMMFIDRCLELLAPGGQLLLGDLPNYSKRLRFFSSQAGIDFHKKYTGKNEMPNLDNISNNEKASKESFDDSQILDLVKHARNKGFDAFILPQANALPMANRREDILIVRP